MAAVKFTEEEDLRLWRYLADNLHVAELPTLNAKLEQFRRDTGSTRHAKVLAGRYKRIIGTLHKADLSLDQKLKLYQHYRIPPNMGFIGIVREVKGVILEDGYVVKYESDDDVNQEEENVADISAENIIGEEAGDDAVSDAVESATVGTQQSSSLKRSGSASEAPVVAVKHVKFLQASPVRVDMPNLEEEVNNSNPRLAPAQDIIQGAGLSGAMVAMKQAIATEVKEAFQTLLEMHKNRIDEENQPASVKQCLSHLKNLVSTMNSPLLVNIEKRIDNALKENDKTVPMDSIRAFLDMGLKMIGH